ncbi:MAG: hypothetical protein IJ517_03915, partial [Alphaproteobacteria bacterium]|nr:hypothetical protein [Alphaproteobacteria bacterium]
MKKIFFVHLLLFCCSLNAALPRDGRSVVYRSASSRTSVASRTTSNATQARTASGVAARSGAARVASRSTRGTMSGANQIAT